MSPSTFFSQLLEKACRALFDPDNCFSATHPFLISPAPNEQESPARTVSEYLEIVPIEGKGFGTVARKDAEAFTLLFSEAPAAIAITDQLDRPREVAAIGQAYRRMSPSIRARFDTLHEGSRPFKTREMRI